MQRHPMVKTLVISLLLTAPAAYAQTRPASSPTAIRTPEPRIDQLFNAEPPVVGGDALASVAFSAAGRFDRAVPILVREAQQPAESRSTADDVFWIVALFEYWSASADQSFLRGIWPHAASAFRRVVARDADGDGLMDHPLTDIRVAAAWIASLDGLAQMAAVMKDNATLAQVQGVARVAHTSFERAFWMESEGWYAITAMRAPELTAWPVRAMAFGVMDTERADRMLVDAASSAMKTGANADAALGHYRMHRGWSGIDQLRDFIRSENTEATEIILPLMKGLIGWQVDAAHRAAAFEPHLPTSWAGMQINGLRIGRDRIDVTVTRERGLYSVHLRRLTRGPPLSIRVAPALPLGADIERIVIDDTDAALNAEESAHDLHGVAELILERDAQVEFHYAGGMDIVAATGGLRVLDFRLEGRDYLIVVEGQAGLQYALQLLARTRSTLQVTMPPGNGQVRKTVRVRAPVR